MENVYFLTNGITSFEDERIVIPDIYTVIEASTSDLESLKGISRFPHIKEIWATHTKITSLKGIEESNVEELACEVSRLISLKGASGSKLKRMWCSDNMIENLNDLEGSSLEEIEIEGNPCYEDFRNLYQYSLKKLYENFSALDYKEPESN